MSTEQQQSTFTGWANVEVFGHSTHVGHVTTEYFGSACMFRVDTPELPERESELKSPEYIKGQWMAAGTKVKRPESPAHSVLLGPSSIFRLTPMTEASALKLIEERYARPLILVDVIPEERRLETSSEVEF
jgi:hypothetical protein